MSIFHKPWSKDLERLLCINPKNNIMFKNLIKFTLFLTKLNFNVKRLPGNKADIRRYFFLLKKFVKASSQTEKKCGGNHMHPNYVFSIFFLQAYAKHIINLRPSEISDKSV